MDLQTYIDNAAKASRAKSLAKSDQLTLGEMILKMEPIVKAHEAKKSERDYEAIVTYDFEYYYPTAIKSWRGSYEELALNIEHYDAQRHSKPLNARQFLGLIYLTQPKIGDKLVALSF